MSMRVTERLAGELARDIERDPNSWVRYQGWLSKKFEAGRVGICLFGGGRALLELDASPERRGNLDRLSWAATWRLRRARLAWVKHRHLTLTLALLKAKRLEAEKKLEPNLKEKP